MFGYIKPLKCELKVKDWDYYQASYCGLCHALKERCGFFARFVINYDFTALAILLSAINSESEKLCLTKRRCIARPVKKPCLISKSDAYSKAADASIILMWWKLADDVLDGPFFCSLNARLASFFLKSAYNRAKSNNPTIDSHLKKSLRELRKLEEKRVPKLDLPADVFARALLCLTFDIENENVRRPLEQIFYHIGRFIYLIDAWDDIKKDLKTGNYNPVVERFGIKTDISEEIEVVLETCLLNDIYAADMAFELLDTSPLHDLIKNIISLGMPNILYRIKNGVKTKKEKAIYERSL